jgi:hypothetical protein
VVPVRTIGPLIAVCSRKNVSIKMTARLFAKLSCTVKLRRAYGFVQTPAVAHFGPRQRLKCANRRSTLDVCASVNR